MFGSERSLGPATLNSSSMRRKATNELVNKPSLETELKKLRQKVADLEFKLVSERLAKRAANRELQLVTACVPWRAAAAWRQIARFVPLPLTRGMASILDGLKIAKQHEFSSGQGQNGQRVTRRASTTLKPVRVRDKIAIVTDCNYWALANTARQVKHFLSNEMDIDIINFPDFENEVQFIIALNGYDVVHFLPRWVLRDLISRPRTRDKIITYSVNDSVQTLFRTTAVTTAVCDHTSLSEAGIDKYQKLFSSIDGYCVCSPKLHEIYSRISAYPPPTAILRDGVDLDFFSPCNRERFETSRVRPLVVGWAGNSAWQASASGADFKGLNTVLRPALEMLARTGVEIVGNFADRQIRLRSYTEMPEYYHSIDVLVCAASIEGTPCPVLEAMACGVPIVSTDVGIVREALGPLQSEFILPERSVESMAAALRRLHNDSGLLSRLSSENLESIRPWDWKLRARTFLPFFKSTIEKRRAAFAGRA